MTGNCLYYTLDLTVNTSVLVLFSFCVPYAKNSLESVFLKLTLSVLKHLEVQVTSLLLSQRLLSRLPQKLLHLGLARIWMVLRNLGDGNVDVNATHMCYESAVCRCYKQ